MTNHEQTAYEAIKTAETEVLLQWRPFAAYISKHPELTVNTLLSPSEDGNTLYTDRHYTEVLDSGKTPDKQRDSGLEISMYGHDEATKDDEEENSDMLRDIIWLDTKKNGKLVIRTIKRQFIHHGQRDEEYELAGAARLNSLTAFAKALREYTGPHKV